MSRVNHIDNSIYTVMLSPISLDRLWGVSTPWLESPGWLDLIWKATHLSIYKGLRPDTAHQSRNQAMRRNCSQIADRKMLQYVTFYLFYLIGQLPWSFFNVCLEQPELLQELCLVAKLSHEVWREFSDRPLCQKSAGCCCDGRLSAALQIQRKGLHMRQFPLIQTGV